MSSPCQVGHGRLLVGLGEAQIGIDTGNDNACIYREEFDAHMGDAKVNVDDEALVQDRLRHSLGGEVIEGDQPMPVSFTTEEG